jgi:hypothetical protein
MTVRSATLPFSRKLFLIRDELAKKVFGDELIGESENVS